MSRQCLGGCGGLHAHTPAPLPDMLHCGLPVPLQHLPGGHLHPSPGRLHRHRAVLPSSRHPHGRLHHGCQRCSEALNPSVILYGVHWSGKQCSSWHSTLTGLFRARQSVIAAVRQRS